MGTRVIRSGKPAEVVHIRERGGVFYRVDERPFLARLLSFLKRELPARSFEAPESGE